MPGKFISRLGIAGSCTLMLGIAAAAAVHVYRSATRAAAEQRVLADYLLVERLPASARDIECREFADSCDPGNSSTICFVRIEPRDFEQLARQAHFRKNEDTCPENFSHTHQMGLPVGPSFKINEEHWAGNAEAQAAIYPDAAHSQFVAVLSRPSRSPLKCMGSATTASIVLHRVR